jgi:hypothetical protein
MITRQHISSTSEWKENVSGKIVMAMMSNEQN